MASIASVYSSVVNDVLIANGSAVNFLGPVSLDLRNDSEDVAYRNASNVGRIDFYNAMVGLVEEPRICDATKQNWTIRITKYLEAKSNENKTIDVVTANYNLISALRNSPPLAWATLFDWYYTSEAQEVLITQIGNTRVYTQAFLINAISYE